MNIEVNIQDKLWNVRDDKVGDADVIAEIYCHDLYHLQAMRLNGFEPETIVDVGAHIGTFAVLAHELWPDAKIICIEPEPRNFELLKLNAPFAQCINGAVRYDGDLIYVQAEGATGGGFVAPRSEADAIKTWKANADGFEYHDTDIEVRSLTLEDLQLPKIDLLKLDAEVADLHIVQNMSPELAARIGIVLGEYHCEGGFDEFKGAAGSKMSHLEFYGGNGGMIGPFWSKKRIVKHDSTGTGNEKKICILFQGNGIGDSIHAMPAIWQKLQDGYDITLYANPDHECLFSTLGVTFKAAGEAGLGFVDEHESEYGKIYSLKALCVDHDEDTKGYSFIDRVDQASNYLETTTPEEFDWRPFLIRREVPFHSKVACGLESTHKPRCYERRDDLVRLLKEVYGLELFDVVDLGMNGGFTATGLSDLIEIIESAKVVVAVDSGVLALALALRKPTVAIFGPTDAKIVAHQFSRFYDTELTVLQNLQEDVCVRPCNFSVTKGYGVNGKCKEHTECTLEITPEQILEKVKELLEPTVQLS